MVTVERIEAVNSTVNAIVAMDVDAARKAARESDETKEIDEASFQAQTSESNRI